MGEGQVEDLVMVLFQSLDLHTGDTVKQTVSGHRAGDPIVAVEQLPPQELIFGHCQPLSAGQASTQHSVMRETQEDLKHQAVWQGWAIIHPDILHGNSTGKSVLLMHTLGQSIVIRPCPTK
uniref:Uncharacterized protein n=1 Tax=Oncorhynchus kisutch TaxID=8019 RepID=A0A8C7HJQ0_ONCKI